MKNRILFSTIALSMLVSLSLGAMEQQDVSLEAAHAVARQRLAAYHFEPEIAQVMRDQIELALLQEANPETLRISPRAVPAIVNRVVNQVMENAPEIFVAPAMNDNNAYDSSSDEEQDNQPEPGMQAEAVQPIKLIDLSQVTMEELPKAIYQQLTILVAPRPKALEQHDDDSSNSSSYDSSSDEYVDAMSPEAVLSLSTALGKLECLSGKHGTKIVMLLANKNNANIARQLIERIIGKISFELRKKEGQDEKLLNQYWQAIAHFFHPSILKSVGDHLCRDHTLRCAAVVADKFELLKCMVTYRQDARSGMNCNHYGNCAHKLVFHEDHSDSDSSSSCSDGSNSENEWTTFHSHDFEREMFLACKRGYTHIVELLLQHGASPNALNISPLHTATRFGHAEIVHLLIEYGANTSEELTLRDNEVIPGDEASWIEAEIGLTPLEIAQKYNHDQVVAALQHTLPSLKRTCINTILNGFKEMTPKEIVGHMAKLPHDLKQCIAREMQNKLSGRVIKLVSWEQQLDELNNINEPDSEALLAFASNHKLMKSDVQVLVVKAMKNEDYTVVQKLLALAKLLPAEVAVAEDSSSDSSSEDEASAEDEKDASAEANANNE